MASLGNRVLAGSALLTAANGVNRALGIISMIVLARLLAPQDYGLVAISGLLLMFVRMFSETGINSFLLSRRELTRSMLDTAWTMRLLTRIVVAAVLFLGARPLAAFYDMPELETVMRVVAVLPLLEGLSSPGLFILTRALQFKRITVMNVSVKLAAFATTVTLAFELRSYWALVIGDVVTGVGLLIGSYVVHGYRPRIAFGGFGTQWAFSKWMYLSGIFGFCRAKADLFLVSRSFELSSLGVYSLAREIAVLPEQQAIRPLGNVFITTINTCRDDSGKTAAAFEGLVVVTAALLVPAATGLYVVAPWLVEAALGERWLPAIPVLKALAALSCTFALASLTRHALVAMERPRQVFLLDLATFLATVIALLVATGHSLETFAWTRSGVGVITALIAAGYMTLVLPIGLARLSISLVPVALGSACMMAALGALDVALGSAAVGPVVGLVALSSLGSIVYATVFGTACIALASRSGTLTFVTNTVAEQWRRSVSRFVMRRARPAGARDETSM